jgi:hypothetical protein
MATYNAGDYVKVEFRDESTRIGEWMRLRVDHCDDEKRLIYGTLDSEPLNDCNGKIGLGSELAVNFSQSREPQKADRVHKAVNIIDLYPSMAYKATTIEDLLAIMKRVQGEKTLTEFAGELDLSKQYLSNVYNRRKEPSERLLDKLGFTRQTTYVRSPTAARKEKRK